MILGDGMIVGVLNGTTWYLSTSGTPSTEVLDRENVSRAEDEVQKDVVEPDPEPEPLVGGLLITMAEVQL